MKKLLMPIAMIMLCAMLTGCFASETPRSTPQATQSAAAQPPAFKTERLKESNPTLKVYDVKQKRIIEMPLEEYLEGVLAGEMPNDWPAEALKAQAILARTFVCKFIDEKKSKYDGADISTDIKEAQAYDADGVNDAIRRAVSATHGEIMVHEGELPYAWFYAHGGGKTALAREGLEFSGTEPGYTQVVDSRDSDEAPAGAQFMDNLKTDVLSSDVFVFTPKGKVISLPAGSTPIDFAYAIHSAVGNSMIGAKVNNRIASYDAPLHNGDIVEILTSKSAKGPSRDWLNICQSNQARVKIKQWFKREKREENIVRGKASFEAELRHAGVDPDILQNTEVLPVILKKVSFECLDDMYAAIGYGGLTAAKAVGRIRDDLTRATRTLAPKPLARQNAPAVNSSGVIVEDIGSCMIKFSRCCTPVPGDEIIGFITKGYGVSVHRKDCPNARAALDPAQKGRWVKVTWAEAPDVMFSTSLEIEADDRDGLMLDVATILTSLRLRTSEMSARSVGGGIAIVCLRFGVHNLTELENVRTRLRGISGVHNVERGTE